VVILFPWELPFLCTSLVVTTSLQPSLTGSDTVEVVIAADELRVNERSDCIANEVNCYPAAASVQSPRLIIAS